MLLHRKDNTQVNLLFQQTFTNESLLQKLLRALMLRGISYGRPKWQQIIKMYICSNFNIHNISNKSVQDTF